jgi:hypothetical protein
LTEKLSSVEFHETGLNTEQSPETENPPPILLVGKVAMPSNQNNNNFVSCFHTAAKKFKNIFEHVFY